MPQRRPEGVGGVGGMRGAVLAGNLPDAGVAGCRRRPVVWIMKGTPSVNETRLYGMAAQGSFRTVLAALYGVSGRMDRDISF